VSPSNSYYIYTAKEIGFFSGIFIAFSCFCFFSGVHLGKSLHSNVNLAMPSPAALIESVSDRLPSEQEFFDNKDAFDLDLHKMLATEAGKEAQELQLRLKKVHQLSLPTEVEKEPEKKEPEKKD
jgi:hypothetical protein